MSRITIKEEHCKGCQYCVTSCPRGLIQIDGKRINLLGYHPATFQGNGEKTCSGCASCAEVCPEVLIEVFRE